MRVVAPWSNMCFSSMWTFGGVSLYMQVWFLTSKLHVYSIADQQKDRHPMRAVQKKNDQGNGL